jgi:hypothetical protein
MSNMPFGMQRVRLAPAVNRPAGPMAEKEAPLGNGQIRERNGIWVASSGGVWLGDYTRRENAIAAVTAVGRDRVRPLPVSS